MQKSARTAGAQSYPHDHVLDILFADISNRYTVGEMAKKATKIRPWTKEDMRTLKALAREKVKTSVIARKLKRSVGATHQKAMRLGVKLGASRKKKKG